VRERLPARSAARSAADGSASPAARRARPAAARVAAAGAVALALVAGCSAGPAAPAAGPAPATTAPAPTTTAPATPDGLDLAVRGPAADTYARTKGGRTGIVVRDRVTGARWANAAADTRFRAASTIKLAIAVDVLAGAPTPADRADVRAMIVTSDNAAADRLWRRVTPAHLRAYGLRDADIPARWGAVRCTPADLERLVTYVLERAAPATRATLTGLLRAVRADQRWGVLAAVDSTRPGAKNGWLPEGAGWALASAGFLGPAERYTVAIMTDGAPSFLDGVATVSGTATTLTLGLD
jgi:hypothetical protein